MMPGTSTTTPGTGTGDDQQIIPGEPTTPGTGPTVPGENLTLTEQQFTQLLDRTTKLPGNVKTPDWTPIIVDRPTLLPKDYIEYLSPYSGKLTNKLPIEDTQKGPLRNFLSKFTGQQTASPEVPGLIDKQELIEVKLGLNSTLSALNSLQDDKKYGLTDIIRRHDINISKNHSYSDNLKTAVDKLVTRTNTINDVTRQLNQELQGVRVIAGTGVPIELVRAEANTISKFNANSITDNTFLSFLTGNYLPDRTNAWFSQMLANNNVATKDSTYLSIQPLLNLFKSDTEIKTMQDYLNNKTAIFDGANKGLLGYKSIFAEPYTVSDMSFSGISGVIKNLDSVIDKKISNLSLPSAGGYGSAEFRTRLSSFGIPILNDTLDLKSLAEKLSNVYPFSSLRDFFFRIEQARESLFGHKFDPNFVGPPEPTLIDKLKALDIQSQGLVGGLKESIYDTTYSYTLTISWTPKFKDTRTRTKTFTHKGLPGVVRDLSPKIESWIKSEVEPDLTFGGIVIDEIHLSSIKVLSSKVLEQFITSITNMIHDKMPGVLPNDLSSGITSTPLSLIQSNTILDSVKKTLPVQVPAGWSPIP